MPKCSPAAPFRASRLAGHPNTKGVVGHCNGRRGLLSTPLYETIDVSAMTCLKIRPPPSTRTNTAIVGFLSWARLPSTRRLQSTMN